MTAIWTIRPKHKLAKFLAYLRHPLSARQRKLFRGRLVEQIEFNGFGSDLKSAAKAAAAANSSCGQANDFGDPADASNRAALTISVIIPNYNHARFLDERLRSILAQSVAISELIILDDASTDNSRDVIRELTKDLSVPVRLAFNDTNSGRIFRQWTKGIELAKGDLIWICESDDTCDAGFLRALVPYFSDPSVMMAFGRIESVDGSGDLVSQSGLQLSDSKFWRDPIVASAHSWFNGPFGNRNIVANVGGCIFRRQQFPRDVVDEFTSYRICGDWFLYSRVARGGRIAYDPAARAYFRVHSSNSSKASLKSEDFYDEHARIAKALRRHYGVGRSTVRLLFQNAWAICAANRGRAAAREFANRISVSQVYKIPRTVGHVLLDVRGGNGRAISFSCQLANALSNKGDDVSLLIDDLASFERMRVSLAPAVCIFSPRFLGGVSEQTLVDQFGVTAAWLADDKASASRMTWERSLGVAAVQNTENFETLGDADVRDAVQRQGDLIHRARSRTA